MSTLETLQELLMKAHTLTREQVMPDALLATVGVDSLGMIELLFQIEDHFGITLADDGKLPPMVTIQDVVDYIDGLVAPQPPATSGAATPAA